MRKKGFWISWWFFSIK